MHYIDTIFIKDLVVTGHHGVKQSERDTNQRFSISIEVTYDTSLARKTDNIDDAVSWSQIRDIVENVVNQNSYRLMERLIDEIEGLIIQNDKILTVTITIRKLDAFKSGYPGIISHYSRT